MEADRVWKAPGHHTARSMQTPPLLRALMMRRSSSRTLPARPKLLRRRNRRRDGHELVRHPSRGEDGNPPPAELVASPRLLELECRTPFGSLFSIGVLETSFFSSLLGRIMLTQPSTCGSSPARCSARPTPNLSGFRTPCPRWGPRERSADASGRAPRQAPAQSPGREPPPGAPPGPQRRASTPRRR